MTPIRITATMRGPMTGAPMLDGLLAWVVAQQRDLVAGFGPTEAIEIPIARETGGRFHLCSSPIVAWDQHEARFIHRRFPIAEAQVFGDANLRRFRISAGACKSYRIPTEVRWAEGGVVTWYAVGDREAVAALLVHVTHIGKKRSVGRGPVERWNVDLCESWGDGFPIARDGAPMRPLPADWPGLADPTLQYGVLTYPYYEHVREELLAVPA